MTDLVKWHRKMFPKATADSQILHLIQEVKEFEKADSAHILDELADIYIVANSLKRWKRLKALVDEALFCYFYDFSEDYQAEILKAVDIKMQIVADRVKNGEYFWNGIDYDRIRNYKQ